MKGQVVYMLRTITNARIYEMGELNIKESNGREVKYISFKIGTRRTTKRTVTDENGNTKKEYINDYMYCMAFGNTAQLLSDYCSNYDEEGNFIPRSVYLEGKVENYTYDKEYTFDKIVKVGGKEYPVTFKEKITQYGCRMIVDQVMFLDAPPENIRKNQGSNNSIVVAGNEITDDTGVDSSKVVVATVVSNNKPDDNVDKDTEDKVGKDTEKGSGLAKDESATDTTDSGSKSKKTSSKSKKSSGKGTKDEKKGGSKSKKSSGKDTKDENEDSKKPKLRTKEIEIEEDDYPLDDDATPGIAGLFN